MKKIFFSIVAIAALAACSKSEVAYEQAPEIGFSVVAGNMTKTAIDGEVYPTSLNMYIYAETDADELYIENGQFKYKGAYKTVTGDTEHTNDPAVWAGWKDGDYYPYYWPNTKKLHFAGYSKSGNVESAAVAYDFDNDQLTIEGYEPGNSTDNDLMFFAKTADYGKDDKYVPVDMYHACSWITFLVKGDGVTGVSGSTYAVESLTITNIYETGDLTCTGTTVEWDFVTNNYPKTANSAVLVDEEEGDPDTKISIAGTYVNESTTNPVKAENPEDNTVLLPQLPGMLELVYSYTSPAGMKITETRSGATALDLTLDGTGTKETNWEPGKHYIYTITIKANEILIAPTPVDWTDGDFNVTVE